MTIIDSERKRPDPVREVSEAIVTALMMALVHSTKSPTDESLNDTCAKAALSRLNQLGMLNENYYEAIRGAKR